MALSAVAAALVAVAVSCAPAGGVRKRPGGEVPAVLASPAQPLGDVGELGEVEASHLFIQGADLPQVAVERLEKELERHPGDLRTRAKLLGYYFLHRDGAARARCGRHVLWVIENAPASAAAAAAYCGLDPREDADAYLQAKKLWKGHLEQSPGDLRLLGNAATFFSNADTPFAITLLEKARDLDSKSVRWPERLAHLIGLGLSCKRGAEKVEAARRASREMRRALELGDGASHRFVLLEDAAKYSFEAGEYPQAEANAKELLELATKLTRSWNTGNAVHHGNLVLGRLALRAGDRKRAIEHLIAAGKTKGSPQLNSFGPNMTLARDLLEKGERDAVLEYFRLCAVFWGADREELKLWTDQVPAFGANLDY